MVVQAASQEDRFRYDIEDLEKRCQVLHCPGKLLSQALSYVDSCSVSLVTYNNYSGLLLS